MSIAANNIKIIISESIELLLKDEGFRKKGNTYYLTGNELTKVVNVQLSRNNYGPYGSFTLNLGVYIPAVAELLGRPNRSFPKEYECTLHTRLGHLVPEKNGEWWDVGEPTNFELLKNELNESWLKYGRSWLDRHSSIEEIEKLFLEEHYSPVVAVAIYILVGKKSNAERLMRQLIEGSNSDFYKQYVNILGILEI